MTVQALRPEQIAQCIVDSYPYMPDIMAIACWVAYGNGDHRALDMLVAQAGPRAGMHSPPLSPGSTEGEFPTDPGLSNVLEMTE